MKDLPDSRMETLYVAPFSFLYLFHKHLSSTQERSYSGNWGYNLEWNKAPAPGPADLS